jgi:lactate 2-monooxygenase
LPSEKKISVNFADVIHRFKALALGADFVQVGRPILWGLAHEGDKGVRHVLKSLLAELEITVGLAGHVSLEDVDRSSLSRSAV